MARSLAETTPRLRGRLHQAAFWVSIPAGIWLISVARTSSARFGGLVYALSLSGLYATSAAFHRVPWSPEMRAWMRRLDHSMIYILIAGTYTPFGLLVFTPPWSTWILGIVWGGALVGIALKFFVRGLAAVAQVLYMTLGWFAVLTLPQMLQSVSRPAVGLLLTGGLFYTAGAVMLWLRRPDPNPLVFGVYEVWHAMVIAGSLCHYAVIFLILTKA